MGDHVCAKDIVLNPSAFCLWRVFSRLWTLTSAGDHSLVLVQSSVINATDWMAKIANVSVLESGSL